VFGGADDRGGCTRFIDIADERLERRVRITLIDGSGCVAGTVASGEEVAKIWTLGIQTTSHGVSISQSGLNHNEADNREMSSFASRCKGAVQC